MEAPQATLQVGDLLYFEFESQAGDDDTSSYILGRADGSVAALPLRGLCEAGESPGAACVFELQAQSTWTRLEQYKHVLESTGTPALEGPKAPETRSAYLDAEAERATQRKGMHSSKGRPVRYGSTVQLLHVATRSYLCTSRRRGEDASSASFGGTVVCLDRDAGESGWFRVMPRLRVHNEGQCVRSGDALMLVALGTGHALLLVGGALHAVDLSLHPAAVVAASLSGFHAHLYRSSKEAEREGVLKSGVSCTFYHKEVGAFLLADRGNEAATEAPGPVRMAVGAADASPTYAIWQVLHEAPMRGDVCQWAGRFRLRHAATGKYLAVRPKPRGEARGDSLLVVTLLSATEALDSPEATVFGFVPQYSQSGDILCAQFLKICHHATQAYLHANVAASSGDPTAAASADGEGGEGGGGGNGGGGGGGGVAGAAIHLHATTRAYDTDIFGVGLVDDAIIHDMGSALAMLPALHAFIARAESHPKPADGGGRSLDMGLATSRLVELIRFVTESDNSDPFTREGIPVRHRQRMLGDFGVIGLAVECIQAPFRSELFTREDIDVRGKAESGTSAVDREAMTLRSLGVLAMRLARHLLREQDENKSSALPLVESLLQLLPCDIGVSDVLAELFTNNAMVERVPDATIALFIELIRSKGRRPMFVRFLEVLLTCGEKPVRKNQWRVAEMLLGRAKDLLLTVEIDEASGRVLVCGDPTYFPHLEVGTAAASSPREAPGGQRRVDLLEWLDSTEAETVGYFAALSSLFASCVRGRNLVVTPQLQQLLPFEVLLAVITNKQLAARHLDVPRAFVRIVHDLYVNNDLYAGDGRPCEKHPPMVVLKTVRRWGELERHAQKRMLTTRHQLEQRPGAPLWSRFDGLKRYALSYLMGFTAGDAHRIAQNKMVLELVRVVHTLIGCGFYRAVELESMIEPVLRLLDGRRDVVGLDVDPGDGLDKDRRARYARRATIAYDTVVIMEAKRVLCEILKLICTVRLDLRLSHLLGMYHEHAIRLRAGQPPLSYAPEGGRSSFGSSLGGTSASITLTRETTQVSSTMTRYRHPPPSLTFSHLLSPSLTLSLRPAPRRSTSTPSSASSPLAALPPTMRRRCCPSWATAGCPRGGPSGPPVTWCP